MNKRIFGTILVSVGFDPRLLLKSVVGVSTFLKSLSKLVAAWIRKDTIDFNIAFCPILSDAGSSSGVAKGHYFHQDLWAARRIHALKPLQHIDVGSRVDGFVAHLLTFMGVTIVDVRPLISKVSGLVFIQKDIMGENGAGGLSSDSLSCLHALEHFGLGRYGDPFDWNGWRKGLVNLASIVKEGGRLYLSVPIGPQVVEFNAHRIFAPQTIINEAEKLGLALYEFSFVDDDGDFYPAAKVDQAVGLRFGCGCFEFVKLPKSLQ
jgi:hypothetical protein